MNKQILILFLIVLSSCSQNNSNSTSQVTDSKNDIERIYEAKIVSPSEQSPIDFGSVYNDKNNILSLTIRNLSDNGEIFSGTPSLPSNSNYSIISSSCSSVSPKSSCSIRMVFNSKDKEPNLYSDILSYDSFSFLLQTNVLAAPTVSLSENIVASQNNIDFGSLYPGQVYVKNIYFTNNSNLPVNKIASISASSGTIQKISDSCSNNSIPVKGSCSIRLAVNSNQSIGTVSGTINYGTTPVLLNGEVLGPLPIDSTSSNLVLSVDNVDYIHDSPPFYHIGDFNVGASILKVLVLKNNGSTSASISSISFNSNPVILSNSCISPLKPKAKCSIRVRFAPIAQGNMDMTVSMNNSSRIFPISYNYPGAETICNTGNALNNGVTSLENVLTVSGNIPNCIVTSCSNPSFVEIAPNQQSCVYKFPTGNISFVQDYTKNLSGNVLNISSSNAQQIQFYSDSSCQNIDGLALGLPISQTNRTVTWGDGVKSVYAKFINGTQSSACLSDSVVLDQTAPVFMAGLVYTTTTEKNDESISIESILISESNAYYVEYSLGSGVSSSNLIGFSTISPFSSSFQATVANGYLPSGFSFAALTDYRIGLRITDSAGNESLVEVVGPFRFQAPVSGTPDPTFGNNLSGDQYSTDGVRSFHNMLNATNFYGDTSASEKFSVEGINAMAMQSDGKIVLVGKTDRTLASPLTTNTDMAVWRINQDGTMDNSFSDDGFFTRVGTETQINNVDIGAEEVFDVKIRPNGKILMVGTGARSTSNFIYTSCVIWQLTPEGNLDTTFGSGNGIAIISGAGGYPVTTAVGPATGNGLPGSDICRSLEIMPDGSFFVAGATKGYHNLDLMIAKFSENGILDTTFSGGKVITLASTPNRVAATTPGFYLYAGASASSSSSANDQAFKIVRKDSFLYIAGQTFSSSNDLSVLKISTSGVADTSFGNQSPKDGLYSDPNTSGTNDVANDIAVLSNNKIVLVGARASGSSATTELRDMAVIQLTSLGALDTSFGSGGRFIQAGAARDGVTNREDVATSLVVLSSGKMVIGGNSNRWNGVSVGDGTINSSGRSQSTIGNAATGANTDMVVWKLNSNGTLDTTFNTKGYLSKGVSEVILASIHSNSVGIVDGNVDFYNAGFGADILSDLLVIDNKIFVSGSVYYGRTSVNTDGVFLRID